ncbi:hypothetical protein BWQ96_06404 [Gracilariopsis chorda]|uniref:Fe2OG dioxygenase domain-containing protein n=1 Tax=Gracilariopsis chorda TaxID=448386 RepID=A0A2V3INZ6_9FLOR|nr:hypothetical protein BWQ96_06404 [Gracilariopsis chorda]|eukprot:PXF43783.1 hypothetical protein BWQ96_06404 [Gracilariopsis chorda]
MPRTQKNSSRKSRHNPKSNSVQCSLHKPIQKRHPQCTSKTGPQRSNQLSGAPGSYSAKCPICSKRFLTSFIEAHASHCSTPSASYVRNKKHSSALSTFLRPRYALTLPTSAQPSETGAPGFHVFRDIFIQQEEEILRAIEATAPAWVDFMFRQTKNYGPAYDLRRKRFLFGERAPKQNSMPPYAKDIVLPRLQLLTPILKDFNPNQLAVGLYKVPGESHILPHNDCENGEIGTAVVGVCLAAACTMTLILRSQYSGVGRDVKRDVHLPKGAVYIMSGDALRVWEHAIFPGKTEATRYSLTFRDVSPIDAASYGVVEKTPKGRFTQSLLT